jgi:murein DD-endopeptidase MepM/ murein hydrolase activator NlpD
MRDVVLIVALLTVGAALLAAFASRNFYLGPGSSVAPESARGERAGVTVDLRERAPYELLPRYVDLCLGDTLHIVSVSGHEMSLRLTAVEVESRRLTCPRTRVLLASSERTVVVRCGMEQSDRSGIAPQTIEGVRIAAEITRLLFSRLPRGSSPFNTYEAFRLNRDVRLAIWSADDGILAGTPGQFVVEQPEWTREKLGNWLHTTRYGLHGAIDIFATRDGVPEPVVSPVEATVYRVYHVDAAAGDSARSKAVNLWGNDAVGPQGERVLYRFQHLSEILVRDGEPVHRGQIIGTTGHTGFESSIGDHLHFEIRLNPSCFGLEKDDSIFATVPVNPYNFLLDWYERRTEAADARRGATS